MHLRHIWWVVSRPVKDACMSSTLLCGVQESCTLMQAALCLQFLHPSVYNPAGNVSLIKYAQG